MTPDARLRDIALVVDDSPETVSMLTDALEAEGVTVLVALDGASALQIAGQVRPDVVLLDAVMPGLDGVETCRALKRMQGLAQVPVIFMTGLSETEHVLAALAAGGVDYVTKPVVPDVVVARMRVHLANARLAQSAHTALDAAGRYLLAVDEEARIIWSTPEAGRLFKTTMPGSDTAGPVLPPSARDWLQDHIRAGAAPEQFAIPADAGGVPPLLLAYIGRGSLGEHLLRLSKGETGSNEALLQTRLALTRREAEVLVWIARGKSNRDIGEILGLSPRTVNKHLEQIYAKLGVENRASATAIAIRALDQD
jgi:DNA-binding NarL/FixJ family response regulator